MGLGVSEITVRLHVLTAIVIIYLNLLSNIIYTLYYTFKFACGPACMIIIEASMYIWLYHTLIDIKCMVIIIL